MRLKTIAQKDAPGAVRLNQYYTSGENGELISYEVWVVETDYTDAQVESFRQAMSGYYLHTVNVFDYESSTDAGDGRDEYSREEDDVDIRLEDCVIADGRLTGFLCSAFEREDVLFLEKGKVTIHHRGNYSGRGYHCYRYCEFELRRRAE